MKQYANTVAVYTYEYREDSKIKLKTKRNRANGGRLKKTVARLGYIEIYELNVYSSPAAISMNFGILPEFISGFIKILSFRALSELFFTER